MNETTALDSAALERLCRLGGDSFASEMIQLFLSYSQQKIAEAREAQASGNAGALSKAVHPIKSSAGNVGSRRVQELATQIEKLANEGQCETLAGLVKDLEEAFAAAKRELEGKKQTLGVKSPSEA